MDASARSFLTETWRSRQLKTAALEIANRISNFDLDWLLLLCLLGSGFFDGRFLERRLLRGRFLRLAVPACIPSGLVVGDVLRRGHAGNCPSDDVKRESLKGLEPDTTQAHVQFLAALLVLVGEPGRERW